MFLFFEHYWDSFSTPVQVGLVSVAPFLGWGLSEVVAARFKTTHYTSLAVLVAIACFVVDLQVVGEIYNVTPSPYALLAWGLFGLFLAYRHDLVIVLGLSLIALIAFVAGFFIDLSGFEWPNAGRLEYYFAPSILCMALPILAKTSVIGRYRRTYFFIGLLFSFFTLEGLVAFPEESLLPVPVWAVEWFYTVLAFAAAGFGIWRCVQAQWAGGTYLSAVFFVIFMVHKFFDWFWKAWPNYAFYLALGCISIVVIILLNRLRTALRQEEG